jgi:hypothetical protein
MHDTNNCKRRFSLSGLGEQVFVNGVEDPQKEIHWHYVEQNAVVRLTVHSLHTTVYEGIPKL